MGHPLASLEMRVALILFLVLVFSIPAAAEPQEDDARSHFERGRELERAGELSEALREFERALELRPSYRLHRHIGRVLTGLGRYLEAVEQFRLFFEEGGDIILPERRQQVEEAMSDARASLSSLRIETLEGARILVDGRELGLAPLTETVRLDPGDHLVEVRLTNHRDFREEISVSVGQEILIEASLEPTPTVGPPPSTPEPPVETPSRRRRVHRAAFYTTLGLAVAALTGGAVMGGLALHEHGQFTALDDPQRSSADDVLLQQHTTRGRTFSIASDALLWPGAALAVVTLIIAFFTDFSEGENAGHADEARRSAPWEALLAW